MARLDAPRNARNERDTRPRSGQAEKPKPSTAPNKGWPFAEGSQNHLDETAAPWPRPSTRPASGWPDRSK